MFDNTTDLCSPSGTAIRQSHLGSETSLVN
nr:MAG TPA: hypothetical protein [Crassvirales sp.]